MEKVKVKIKIKIKIYKNMKIILILILMNLYKLNKKFFHDFFSSRNFFYLFINNKTIK